jgi:hypothetical protein
VSALERLQAVDSARAAALAALGDVEAAAIATMVLAMVDPIDPDEPVLTVPDDREFLAAILLAAVPAAGIASVHRIGQEGDLVDEVERELLVALAHVREAKAMRDAP